MSHRLEIANLLSEGKTFNDVETLTGASSTTISRVSRCIKYGNGYKTVLDRMNNE